MTFFPDQLYHDVPGDLNPWDVRFEPEDAAHLSIERDGRVRFRLISEPTFKAAHVVTDDGVGHDMALLFDEAKIQVWETVIGIPDGTRYTFALETADGRPVYRVPAGVGNAVERLDRWTFSSNQTRRAETPLWTHGMVMYQIFPERFRNGNPAISPPSAVAWGTEPGWLDFQGGDLIGIAEKADHLSDLGVDCVYLNPVFSAPSTHRYDAVDYYNVDPALGGNDALARLVAELHKRDIRLIIDASFNHCHPRFFAFADVLENGPDSKYADWFQITDWPPRMVFRPDNLSAEGYRDPKAYREYIDRFIATTDVPIERGSGTGPSVELTYDAWYGVPTLPRIDLTNPAARRYFLDVARHWVREFGIDGWRMDVARYVDFDFWPAFRKAVKTEDPDAYLIAEIMGNASAWLQGNTFDATMNYTFRQLTLDFFAKQTSTGTELADGLARMYAAYTPDATASSQNLISSHDTARFLYEACDDRHRLWMATVFQMTVPGSPGLYYGDEVGMSGGEEHGARGAFPWHEPAAWDRNQLEAVRSLALLRRSHPALRLGSIEIVSRTADGIAFIRSDGAERILVVLDRGTAGTTTTVALDAKEPRIIWGNGRVESVGGEVSVTPASGAVVVGL